MGRAVRVCFDKRSMSGCFRGSCRTPLSLGLSRAARVACLSLLLVACSEKPRDATRQTTHDLVEDNHVRCALAGAADFAPVCTVETSRGPDGEVWIIRHPDGGFRRFVLIDGGRRIATADGAEEVKADRLGADLQVRVANDRYLLPAAPDARPS
jgi:hypothetical protein